MAVGFSGASGDTLTRTSNLFSLANFTVCLFARVGSTSGYITPLGMWGASEALLQIESGSPEIYNGGVVCNSANSYSLNDWIFLGMRGDGTDNSGDEWSLFDGLANAATALTKTNGSRASSFTPTTFRLGESNYGEYMEGALLALKVWTASLTDAEIERERRQLAPVRTANLWGFFPLLKTADKLKDFGGNAYDLTNGTGPWTEEANPPVPWSAGRRKPIIVTAGGATEYNRTASLSSVIQAELNKTSSLSAVVQQQDIQRTASLSALIQAEGLLASSLSALIQAELQRSASLNAVVQAALEKTTSLSAVLQVAQALTLGISAVVQSEEVRSTALAAVVQAALSKTASLSSVIQAEGSGSTSLSSVIQAALAQSTSLDAVIIATGAGTLTAALDAIIKAELTRTASLSAVIQVADNARTSSLSAVVQAAIAATAALSAVVQAEGSKTSNLSAVVQAEGLRAATLSGVVQAEGVASSSLSAVLQAALALQASLNAVITDPGGGGSFSLSTALNAVIIDALLGWWRCDDDEPKGLVAKWKCDDSDPTIMRDERAGNPLTIVGSVPVVPGKVGNAREFRQVGGVATPPVAYGTGTPSAALLSALRGSYTVAFWMWRAAGAAYDNQLILSVQPTADPTDAEAYNFLTSISLYVNGQLTVGWEHSAGINVGGLHTIPVVEEDWQHVVVRVTRTGASALVEVFTDGVYRSSDTELGATGGTAAEMVVMVGAGRAHSAAGTLRSQLHADLDDLRVYNRALTNAEIAQLAGTEDRMFDETGRNDLVFGGITNPPVQRPSGLGDGARRFNSLYVQTFEKEPPSSLLAEALRGEMSLSMWLKADNDASMQNVFTVGQSAYGDTTGRVFVELAGPAQWYVYTCGRYASFTAPVSTWFHLGAVLRRVTGEQYRLHLYLNGVEVATSAVGTLVLNPVTLLHIADTSWPYYGFDGWIDDIRLYGRALSVEEMATLGSRRSIRQLPHGAGVVTLDVDGSVQTLVLPDNKKTVRDTDG